MNFDERNATCSSLYIFDSIFVLETAVVKDFGNI